MKRRGLGNPEKERESYKVKDAHVPGAISKHFGFSQMVSIRCQLVGQIGKVLDRLQNVFYA